MDTIKKQNYIDAVRGWAILLVITAHAGGMFAALPYPVKKLTNFGGHGVQMFFLASAVTLLMSWHQRDEQGGLAVHSFFMRRFFRIAPMYYAGALIYYLTETPESGFNLPQALRSLTFMNAWKPEWIPTTEDWIVVPGGWSIAVEFTFYAIFPILAALIVTLPRAIVFFAATLIVAYLSNYAVSGLLTGYSDNAAGDFLYFWFPNQAPVFAMGFVLYFLIASSGPRITSQKLTYRLLAAIAMICVVTAEYPSRPNLFSVSTSGWLPGMPTILIATLTFMGFIFVLAKGPETLFTHACIRRIGTLSFSAYVLHFLFVHQLPNWSFGLIDRSATGYAAIGATAALWIATMICTLAAAAVTHAVIEQPGIALARKLTARHRGATTSGMGRNVMRGA